MCREAWSASRPTRLPEGGTPLFALVLGFAAVAAVLPLVVRRLGTRVFYLAAVPPFAACIWALSNWSAVADGGAVVQDAQWVPALGLTLGLRFDGFSFLMVGLVAGIGVLVFVYAGSYFHADNPIMGKFSATLLVFSGSMFGLVLADNLLALFLFWELTSITSYLLIGTDDRKVAARVGCAPGAADHRWRWPGHARRIHPAG